MPNHPKGIAASIAAFAKWAFWRTWYFVLPARRRGGEQFAAAETGEVLFEAAIQDTDITGYGVTAQGAMEDLAAKLMGAKCGGET